jgi:cytochrome c oxidase subunit 1
MAYYDYTDPSTAPWAPWVILSTIGGLVLLVSGVLFLAVLVIGSRAPRAEPGPYRFSLALHPPQRLPVALNSFGLWIGLMIALTVMNYGFPMLHLVAEGNAVPAIIVGARR